MKQTSSSSSSRKIFSDPFNLYFTSVLPSLESNVERLVESFQWMEQRKKVLERRIKGKRTLIQECLKEGMLERALVVMKRKRMYKAQMERIVEGMNTLRDSMLTFQLEHDIRILLGIDVEGHNVAHAALQRIERYA